MGYLIILFYSMEKQKKELSKTMQCAFLCSVRVYFNEVLHRNNDLLEI